MLRTRIYVYIKFPLKIFSLYNVEPDTRDRESFMNWMCRVHNYVNARKGKPVFDCSEAWEQWQYRGCQEM